jgi:hypothetical protein
MISHWRNRASHRFGDATQRGRMSKAGRHPVKNDVPLRAQVAGVEGLLSESFGG